jgi:transposase
LEVQNGKKHAIPGHSDTTEPATVPPICLAPSDRRTPRAGAEAIPARRVNYILKLLYIGCQWKELPIVEDEEARSEIHDTCIYSAFRRWQASGCFDVIFTVVVMQLHQRGCLNVTVIHGDGTTTAAKKGGDNIGFNGYKKIKGDKVVAYQTVLDQKALATAKSTWVMGAAVDICPSYV